MEIGANAVAPDQSTYTANMGGHGDEGEVVASWRSGASLRVAVRGYARADQSIWPSSSNVLTTSAAETTVCEMTR
jgi:hypothetical protein